MPPRPKFSREEIVEAALRVVSEKGVEALTAKALGDALGSSARPIFTVFRSMKEVQDEVRAAAMADCASIPLEKCAGRIAAASAGLYPPGVPLVCPGEIIPQEVIDRLQHAKNQERFGVEGDTLLCVNV